VYLLCACRLKFTKFYSKIKYGYKKIAEFVGDFKTIEEIAKKLGIETFGFVGKSLLICSLHIMLPFLQYLFALYISSPCKLLCQKFPWKNSQW
jgi:hypothetical protein